MPPTVSRFVGSAFLKTASLALAVLLHPLAICDAAETAKEKSEPAPASQPPAQSLSPSTSDKYAPAKSHAAKTAGGASEPVFEDGQADMAPLASRSLLLDGDYSGLRLVVVGDRGHVLLSDDGGERWRQAACPTRAMLTGVAFAGGSPRGWAVGHLGVILSTSDGGETWQKQNSGLSADDVLLDVLVLSPEHVIAVGAYGVFVETQSAGATWEKHSVHDEQLHFNRLSRGRDGTLFIGGEAGLLLRSNDQGASWHTISISYDGSFFGLLPLEKTSMLVYGLRGHAFHSSDSGENWKAATGLPPNLLASAIRLRDERVVVAGQSGNFAVSNDGGRSFHLWRPGVSGAVADILESPDGRLIVFGETGVHSVALPPVEPAATP